MGLCLSWCGTFRRELDVAFRLLSMINIRSIIASITLVTTAIIYTYSCTFDLVATLNPKPTIVALISKMKTRLEQHFEANADRGQHKFHFRHV